MLMLVEFEVVLGVVTLALEATLPCSFSMGSLHLPVSDPRLLSNLHTPHQLTHKEQELVT